MKRLFELLWVLCAALLLSGCAVGQPEYFDELTEEERLTLIRNAKVVALQRNAVPAHLQGVFSELSPSERIVYTGNKEGKATFRWEIYESPANANRLTQKDINPYWVTVYAIGDLLDPDWKLRHAREDKNFSTMQLPQRQKSRPVNPNGSRPVNEVRYKR